MSVLTDLITIAAVALGGYFLYSLISTKTTAQTSTPSYTLPALASSLGSGTVQGLTTGENYMNTPAAWDTSAGNVLALATQTQSWISSGIGVAVSPITLGINSLGDWVGGWI